MEYNQPILTTKSYDPRFFIWMTVFLFVVAGSILTYITITSINEESSTYREPWPVFVTKKNAEKDLK